MKLDTKTKKSSHFVQWCYDIMQVCSVLVIVFGYYGNKEECFIFVFSPNILWRLQHVIKKEKMMKCVSQFFLSFLPWFTVLMEAILKVTMATTYKMYLKHFLSKLCNPKTYYLAKNHWHKAENTEKLDISNF